MTLKAKLSYEGKTKEAGFPVNEPVLSYDFEDVNGQTVKDVSAQAQEITEL